MLNVSVLSILQCICGGKMGEAILTQTRGVENLCN